MLSEFLVSLGLFFLILTANVMVLSSASVSSSKAGATADALEIAQQGMEEALAAPKLGRQFRSFNSNARSVESFTYHRTTRVLELDKDKAGLNLVTVTVEWGQGRVVRLERYVPSV